MANSSKIYSVVQKKNKFTLFRDSAKLWFFKKVHFYKCIKIATGRGARWRSS